MAERARDDNALAVDWGDLAPLRIKARAIAEGIYAGAHRSVRKGAGVEFGGQRPYVPGDDLRFFDRRALLRHDRWMVREFETETDRAVWLVVDATASMAYRGEGSPGAKLAYASLLAAAVARIALGSGDPVGLVTFGGDGGATLPATAGREAFDRTCGALESLRGAGDASADARALERALAPIARRSRRGSVILFFSDLLDVPDDALASFGSLATHGRALVAVRVLDRAEVELPFKGTVRLRALEGRAVVEADADAVREEYRARLAAIAARWSKDLAGRGGRLVETTTSTDPTEAVRSIVRAIAEARR